ncbi:unnamed protein product [Rangifer tarandus platyrhynchus]|uniref:Uncharacterized protein n=1 Tax=Rangifer tarandus platyrhynchus TaxID=3082113 RepID=A0ABN8ZPP2_RANTA|nr:unnamed protein product [Rangifer tarandus platyrhynchus]
MRRQRRGGWKRRSKMEAGRERESASGERAGRARAPRGGGRPRRPVRGAAVAGRPGASGDGCGRGGHPGTLVAPHPSRGPRKLCPRPLGHYGDGRGSLCGALGPAAKPALRPPARTLGTRPRPAGPGRGGLVRMPSAALRFSGLLAAAASSHDNELPSAEGPGGRSARRPAQASSQWGGAGGWRLGQRGRQSRAFPLSALPAPDGGLLVKRVQAGALPR